MFVLQDTSVEFKALEAHLKVVADRLLSKATPIASSIKLGAGKTIYPPSEPQQGLIYRLKEGVLAYSILGAPLFHYEAGEIVGLEHLVSRSPSVVTSDFAVIVDSYSGAKLLELAQSDREVAASLQEYLACHAQLLAHLCQAFLRKNAEAAPEIRAIMSGEEIFIEGTNATEVFTLVEGEAEAIVGGVAVGKVMPGELFGVVAALAGTTRSATVRATKNCTVLVIAKDNFSQLIESRPSTVLRMVEEMARTLVSSESAMSQVSLSRF